MDATSQSADVVFKSPGRFSKEPRCWIHTVSNESTEPGDEIHWDSGWASAALIRTSALPFSSKLRKRYVV